jgi:hypothetical protein
MSALIASARAIEVFLDLAVAGMLVLLFYAIARHVHAMSTQAEKTVEAMSDDVTDISGNVRRESHDLGKTIGSFVATVVQSFTTKPRAKRRRSEKIA